MTFTPPLFPPCQGEIKRGSILFMNPYSHHEKDGLLRCSRYSFAPNRLHYCGPNAGDEILAYIENNTTDIALAAIMRQFSTLYPYLKLIAKSNAIKNPFQNSVVQAYWIGNELLEKVSGPAFYRSLVDIHKIKQKIGSASFELIKNKIRNGAIVHHSFHVLNIWRRTGHIDKEHTLESMDLCRISSGIVRYADAPFITVETEPLALQNGKLCLGSPILKRLILPFSSDISMECVKCNDIVSIHWNTPAEVISLKEALQLKKYTLYSIAHANQTI